MAGQSGYLPAVLEIAGLVASWWARRCSSTAENSSCPFSKPSNTTETATLHPEIALGGLLGARMDLTQNQLLQRGFLLGSCVVCTNEDSEEETYSLSVGLSPTLITKLACSCNLPLIAHDLYDSKQRLFLAQEALKIIDRCGIKYKSHCLMHRRIELHAVVSSRSIQDINDYFGGSIAIFFTWLNYLSVTLTLPGYFGLFVFAYQFHTGITDDWYTPLYCCFVILWNIVFVKLWRQHVSISKFSWGQNDQFFTAEATDEDTMRERPKVNQNLSKAAVVFGIASHWIACVVFCLLFLITVPLLISGYRTIIQSAPILDVLMSSVTNFIGSATFDAIVLDGNHFALLIFCSFSFAIELIGRSLFCPVLASLVFWKDDSDAKEVRMSKIHVDVSYTLLCRFSTLLYLCLWEHNVLQTQLLLSMRLVIDIIELMYSASKRQKIALCKFRVPKSVNNRAATRFKCSRDDPKTSPSKGSERDDEIENKNIQRQESRGSSGHNHVDGAEEESLPDSTATGDTKKKRRRLHVKTIARAMSRVKKYVTGSEESSSRSPSPMPDLTKVSSITTLSSGSVENDEVVINNEKKDEIWQPQTKIKIDAGQESEKLLIEDVYAPVFHIEEGHATKLYLFGVVAIFSSIVPLAPLIVIALSSAIYNQDLACIYSSQRPLLKTMRNVETLFEFLNEWMIFIESLCVIAIVVNCYLAFAVSRHGHLYVPDVVFGNDDAGALIFTVAFEHVCIVAYFLINMLLVDVPSWIKKGIVDAKLEEDKKRVSERRLLYELQNPTNSSPKEVEKLLQLRRLLNIEESSAPATNIQSVAATKIAALYNSCGWAMNPFTFLGFTIIPTVLHYFYEPLYHYSIPALFLFASYVHELRERRVKAAVLGMVSDPEILRLLVKDLPEWAKDSDRHQCRWLNILAKQCMSLCQVYEIRLQTKFNETFDRIKPAFVSGMAIEAMSFGTIPPDILSVKILPSLPGVKTITADVEISYTGDFRMVIVVGLFGQAMKLDFYDLCLKGVARLQIEPSDLTPEVAAAQQGFKPFSVAKLSFMKKPFVNISFSLGESDGRKVKSESRGIEANIGQIVKQMIATKALYPKCIQINLDKSRSTGESYAIAKPIGVLQVQVIGCTSLEIGDITTSDPFVEVRYADEIEKTAVVFKTLNPTWSDECFEFLVFNDDVTSVEFTVYDYDLTSSPDFLGNARYEFNPKSSGDTQELKLSLEGVSTGELLTSVTYYRLTDATIDKKAVTELLGSLPTDVIIGDIINPEYALPLVDSKSDYKEMKLYQTSKKNKKRRLTLSMLEGIGKKILNPALSDVGQGQNVIRGVLMISRIACKELQLPSGSLGLSSFYPYLQFSVNGLKRRTKSCRGTLNPSFYDEYKAFILRDDASSGVLASDLHLVIKLKTSKSLKKDVTVAAVKIMIKHITDAVGQELYINQPLIGEDGNEEGKIQAHLNVISAKV